MALYHKVLKKVLRYRFKNRNFATLKHSYQIDEKIHIILYRHVGHSHHLSKRRIFSKN